MKSIDNFLDKVTMYRLMLSFLILLVGSALLFSGFDLLPYSPEGILYLVFVMILISFLLNKFFSRIYNIPLNIESVYITVLILSLIITPPKVGEYISILPFLFLVSLFAVASKFLLNIGNKHIFNPAAVAIVLTTHTINQSASWWAGTLFLTPVILVGGLLVVRKLKQFYLVITFIVVSMLVLAAISLNSGNVFFTLKTALIYSPLLFFAFVMLTEPLTSPYTKRNRIAYAVLVGLLFNSQLHIGTFYFSPEFALLVGNIFAYSVNPKGRFIFIVKEIKKIKGDLFDLVLSANRPVQNIPGQYMEWTLETNGIDNRGNRRYFTIASSPTEQYPRLGVRFYPNSSRFKQKLFSLKVGDKIIGGQLSGDFVLPKDKDKKLVFLAGGIGVTPFRSMTKFLLDKNENRDIIMIYSNRISDEIAYKEIFDEAEDKLSFKMIYTLSETKKLPQNWTGEKGFIDESMIKKYIPDFKERTFYISGSHGMVTAFNDLLKRMGIASSQIKNDFFPGLV